MGYYNIRQNGMLQAWQINAAEMMFRGCTDEEIARELFKTGNDEKKIRNGKDRLRRLRRNEKFQEYYRTIITEWSVHNVGRALSKIAQQIDDPSPWVANKAANDILNQSKRIITGNDENAISIKFEGMPELGEPGGE